MRDRSANSSQVGWIGTRRWRLTYVALAALLVAPSANAVASADPAMGKQLHDKSCIACHAQRYGGDGSKIYLRADRLIHDRAALDRRVAMCSAMTNTGWLPDDEANVAEYLATKYYKFGAPAGKK